MSKLNMSWDRVVQHLYRTIWHQNANALSKPAALLIRPLQICYTAVQRYVRDKCALHASALTFYSLLSVVPVAAMAFGIAKGFGLEQRLERQLYLRFAGQEEVLSKIIDFARTLLDNTQGGLIAGIGIAVLFWSSIKVMSHIESTLNMIWSVNGRPLIRKFTNYLTILIISPLLIIVSSSVNVFISTQVLAATERWATLQAAGPVILMALKLLPFGLIWLLFIMLYLVLPNTQVRLRSALIAGIVAGSLFQLTQDFYISAQVVVARYNAIYGSFAALPLFLIWLQLSWMVVLLGAQMAHAHQYIDRFSTNPDWQDNSPDFEKRCALSILRLIFKGFSDGALPLTAPKISRQLMLPFALVRKLLDELQQCGLLAAVDQSRSNGPAYQPAKDIHTIRIADVINALDLLGRPAAQPHSKNDWEAVNRAVEAMHKEIERASANILVKDI